MANDSKTARPGPVRVVLAGLVALLVAGGLAVWVFGVPAPAQQAAAIGGPFTLTDGAGKTVTDADFRGKYMLVYFGYTFCPDVCPTTLNDVGQAMDKLGKLAVDIRPVFITVDPARDTPAVVRQYAAAFSPRLVGLTGTPEQIAAVAREYRVYYAKHVTGPGPGDYTMDHSSILYLMDAKGPLRRDHPRRRGCRRHRRRPHQIPILPGAMPMRVAAAATLAMLLAMPAWAQPATVAVTGAWSRASAGPAQTGAVYVTVTASQPDRLTGASTPAADMAEVHRTRLEHGVMEMRPVEGGLDVTPGVADPHGPRRLPHHADGPEAAAEGG